MFKNRTFHGNRVTSHCAHEFPPASCNILRLDRRKHLCSSRDAHPLSSTFETLRPRRSLHLFRVPTLNHSLPHPHVSPFRQYSLPHTLHSAFLYGPWGLAHVILLPLGARSRDSPRLPLATLPRLPRSHSASLPRSPGRSPTAPHRHHALTLCISRLVTPHC
jgi:hypothetical protein